MDPYFKLMGEALAHQMSPTPYGVPDAIAGFVRRSNARHRPAAWWSQLKVDAADRHLIDDYKVALAHKRKGYKCVQIQCYETGRRVVLARVIMRAPEGAVVDHVNGDPLDNRRSNLRVCSVTENNRNVPAQAGSSQYKGVRWAGKKWTAGIQVNKKRLHLGRFENEDDAARAYDEAAVQHFGEFARLNFAPDTHRDPIGSVGTSGGEPMPFNRPILQIVGLPAPSRVLTIPVKGIYFDQIASGEKLEEYRLVNPYWGKRLRERSYDHVVLTRGYPKGGGVEGVTRLTRQWRGAVVRTITHPHFGPEPELVFAIDVSEPVIGRSCTCHPIDRPLGDCPRKYAVAECRRAAQTIEAAPLATFIPHHIAFDDWIETILERLHDGEPLEGAE